MKCLTNAARAVMSSMVLFNAVWLFVGHSEKIDAVETGNPVMKIVESLGHLETGSGNVEG